MASISPGDRAETSSTSPAGVKSPVANALLASLPGERRVVSPSQLPARCQAPARPELAAPEASPCPAGGTREAAVGAAGAVVLSAALHVEDAAQHGAV